LDNDSEIGRVAVKHSVDGPVVRCIQPSQLRLASTLAGLVWGYLRPPVANRRGISRCKRNHCASTRGTGCCSALGTVVFQWGGGARGGAIGTMLV